MHKTQAQGVSKKINLMEGEKNRTDKETRFMSPGEGPELRNVLPRGCIGLKEV